MDNNILELFRRVQENKKLVLNMITNPEEFEKFEQKRRELRQAEADLAEFEEIYAQLSNISWEDKYYEINDLCSAAETEVEDRQEEVARLENELHKLQHEEAA